MRHIVKNQLLTKNLKKCKKVTLISRKKFSVKSNSHVYQNMTCQRRTGRINCLAIW